MTTILTSFGARNVDGSVSDAGRERAIKLYEEFSQNGKLDLPFPCTPEVQPNPYHNPNLRDREKYAAWHERWIDGTYKSILESLDGNQNFVIPVFDPTGVAAKLNMKIPNLDLGSIVGSFAVPFVAVPALLDIKPLDIPNFIPNLTGLIKPPNIPIPKLPKLPNIWGGGGIPGFPSLEGFNLALFGAIPDLFKSLLGELANPGWWLDFTPMKLFELSCKVTQKTMPPSKTKDPYTADANKAMITVLQSEALAARMAGEIIGATALLRIMGEKKGYLAQQKTDPAEDAEAMRNGLYRLQSNEINIAVLFPQRKYFYGDQLTIDSIQALGSHMNEEKSYRKSESEDSVTLEIGNITGKDLKSGWRFNPWSKSHKGASFDSAYPMRDEKGVWMSGVANSSVLEGEDAGAFGSSPFKCVKGNPNDPFLVNGKLAHDFPAMYEMGRWFFHEWLPGLIKEQRLKPWKENGVKVVPFRTILIGEKIFQEFNVWASKEFGKFWNTDHKKLYSGWSLMSTAMFTPWPAHEDHMHWAGQRTRSDAEASSKMNGVGVYLCNPATETNFPYEKKIIYVDDNKKEEVRV